MYVLSYYKNFKVQSFKYTVKIQFLPHNKQCVFMIEGDWPYTAYNKTYIYIPTSALNINNSL